ncbi:flagellar biosynthetic protein FliO [Paenibacillus glacialis]|uniref:Flagellar protein n=1 Tax=Paenibacillus glacialis TaxID=494026 RepID=A0A168K0G3_9BACL|nr:flagellar biosynthetic protein FliO [Paenibacillus glacialis]OAB41346.1 flagellar protein [Paenibacillus glacialis]
MSETDQGLDTVNYGLNIVYVIVVLAVIIGLIILLIRFLGTKNKSWFSNPTIRILGGVGLGPNKTLQVIEVGNSVYLIGVGENINLVDKISDPDEVISILAALQEEAAMKGNVLPPFLSKIVSKLRREQPSQEIELDDGTSFHEVFDSKIRRMSSRKDKMEELLREDNNNDRLMDP